MSLKLIHLFLLTFSKVPTKKVHMQLALLLYWIELIKHHQSYTFFYYYLTFPF